MHLSIPENSKDTHLKHSEKTSLLSKKLNRVIKELSSAKRPLSSRGMALDNQTQLIFLKKLIKRLSAPVGFSRLGNDILPFSNKIEYGPTWKKGSKVF